MRWTECRVRDERQDPGEDRASRLISVNFFLIDNSYNREAELTDLETTSRGLERAAPLAGHSSLASVKKILTILQNKATKAQPFRKIGRDCPAIPILNHRRLGASRNPSSSFPIDRSGLDLRF